MNISTRVIALMKTRGVTISDIARRANVPRQSISQALNANRFSFGTLERIATGLGVPLWLLLVSETEVLQYIQAHQPAAPTASTPAVCPHCGKPLAISIAAAVE